MRVVFKNEQIKDLFLCVRQCFDYFQQLLVRQIVNRPTVNTRVLLVYLFMIRFVFYILSKMVIYRIYNNPPDPAFKSPLEGIFVEVAEYFIKRII